MTRSAPLLLLLFVALCGCGAAVAPDLTDGAVDGSAADVFPPCPAEFPGQTQCPRVGMQCSYRFASCGQTYLCICNNQAPFPHPRWQGGCIIDPCF